MGAIVGEKPAPAGTGRHNVYMKNTALALINKALIAILYAVKELACRCLAAAPLSSRQHLRVQWR
ncbi:hypothetical protein BLL52_3557 [Rhodoferax antarcticus ANT.BR]|uniref:Uncharacterized protein n=1 Tax=Rhodoferax antarcticus ANT.BR TaxID=1111071 RepID=A0A1Q8YBK0_9BURK|nr:hypothetical protein BLL52_3557 [Rhodoferax antarcticus ANT.BR]